MQPPKLGDAPQEDQAILRAAKDAADERNSGPKPPWWKFWADPRSSEADVTDER